MPRYIVKKEVDAKAMTRGLYNELQGWTIPEDEDPCDPGYFLCEPGAKDPFKEGYCTWMPREEFLKVSTQTDAGVPFGDALEAAKNGKGFRLPSWSPDVTIRCRKPDDESDMTASYLYAASRFGKVPWKETMIELFSDNWVIVD